MAKFKKGDIIHKVTGFVIKDDRNYYFEIVDIGDVKYVYNCYCKATNEYIGYFSFPIDDIDATNELYKPDSIPEDIKLIDEQDDLYCNCSNPQIIENWVGTVDNKFYYCKNCNKESLTMKACGRDLTLKINGVKIT